MARFIVMNIVDLHDDLDANVELEFASNEDHSEATLAEDSATCSTITKRSRRNTSASWGQKTLARMQRVRASREEQSTAAKLAAVADGSVACPMGSDALERVLLPRSYSTSSVVLSLDSLSSSDAAPRKRRALRRESSRVSTSTRSSRSPFFQRMINNRTESRAHGCAGQVGPDTTSPETKQLDLCIIEEAPELVDQAEETISSVSTTDSDAESQRTTSSFASLLRHMEDDEGLFDEIEVQEAPELELPEVPAPPVTHSSSLRRMVCAKYCIGCETAYTGFGEKCGACRKAGKGQSLLCGCCGTYFWGFREVCSDCVVSDSE